MNKGAIMLSINIQTPDSVMQILRDKFKARRLSSKLTQEGLAKRSGVSLGSLKRFEKTTEISLRSLLKLALVLECLDDFINIADSKPSKINSIDELLKSSKVKSPKRGSIK